MTRTHLMYGTPTYTTWSAMLTRCNNSKNHKYASYGARGIKVCERWRDFQSFLDDMGARPVGTTLGRRDNDGDYEPSNCEWQDATTQARNKRNTAEFLFQGILATVPAHCERLGLSASTVRSRIYTYKWTIEKAMSQQPRNWGGPVKKSITTPTA
ncbi:MAG: hypothetical protein Q7T97_02325 [Burkholderiaceae bacterium]|nr:hypothetical protein [Burkholderiaceae bacterium]